MRRKVATTYRKMAEESGSALIPCGSALESVRRLPDFGYENGGISLYRDGYHMHLVYGRYLMGCVMYEYLCGGNILEAPFIPYDPEFGPSDMNLIDTIKYTVHGFLRNYNGN